jgi:nitrogen regulatory protein P-II 1
MKLFVLVLNKTEYLNKVLEGFLEIGIHGATVIDSTGMGQTLSSTCKGSIFGGLRHLFEDCRVHNLTIFSVLDETKVKEARQVVNNIVGDINNPGTGIIFTLPLDFVSGLADGTD